MVSGYSTLPVCTTPVAEFCQNKRFQEHDIDWQQVS